MRRISSSDWWAFSQDLRLPDYQSRDYDHLADALRFAESHLSRRLGLNELAARAGLSAYQFDRRVRRIFGMSAGQWLIKLRIDFAERRLRESSDSVSTIALDAGYADQSAFCAAVSPLDWPDPAGISGDHADGTPGNMSSARAQTIQAPGGAPWAPALETTRSLRERIKNGSSPRVMASAS